MANIPHRLPDLQGDPELPSFAGGHVRYTSLDSFDGHITECHLFVAEGPLFYTVSISSPTLHPNPVIRRISHILTRLPVPFRCVFQDGIHSPVL